MREMLEVGQLLRVTCERREMKEGHHGSQRSALGRSRGPFWCIRRVCYSTHYGTRGSLRASRTAMMERRRQKPDGVGLKSGWEGRE